MPQSAPAKTKLFAADVHKHALVRAHIALLAGVALNNGAVALVQRAGQLGIGGFLGCKLVLQALQLLLFGGNRHLVLDQQENQLAAKRHKSKGHQPAGKQSFSLFHLKDRLPSVQIHITAYV